MSKSELKPRLPRSWPATVRSAMLDVLSLAKYAAVYTRSWAADSPNVRVRLQAENNRLLQEVALLREEVRIKDARMACLPPHRRPFYPAPERMAILEVRAARGWSLEQTAESFLVCRKTIASWMRRLDEQGSEALVQLRTPVNKFPDFVRYAVQRLQTFMSVLGEEEAGRGSCGPAGGTASTTTYTYGPGNAWTVETGETVVTGSVTTKTVAYSYNLQGQLSVATVKTFDPSTGALTSDQQTTYGYDADRNRVSALLQTDTALNGTYDKSVLTQFLIDPQNHTDYSQVLRQTTTDTTTGHIQSVVTYAIGLNVIAQSTTLYTNGVAGTPQTLVLGYDAHGSVRMLLDMTAAIATRCSTQRQASTTTGPAGTTRPRRVSCRSTPSPGISRIPRVCTSTCTQTAIRSTASIRPEMMSLRT